ncbi:MAG: calcium/sodium antiporter [Candidatus Hydrogenedentales bacterium]
MLNYLLLIVGLILLIKGADWLVRGASSIARSLHISPFVIGLTVVSFGTSLPELVIGIAAGLQETPNLTIGNVVGSNIANILLILGVSSVIYPLQASRGTIWRELPFTLVASLVLAALLNDTLLDGSPESTLGHADGLILLAFFSIFLYYVAQIIRATPDPEFMGVQASDPPLRSTLEVIAGLVALIIGGHLTVDTAVRIAESWGMSQVFIGLTVIAVGTSLPELATSAVAAYKKNPDIAVGNVVGSNIFNIFIVLGLSAQVMPLPFDPLYNFDVGFMIVTNLVLFLVMFTGKERRTIQRWEGGLFVASYVIYLAYLVNRG